MHNPSYSIVYGRDVLYGLYQLSCYNLQTSAHDVRIEAKRIEHLQKTKLALKCQESINELQGQFMQREPFLDETDLEIGLFPCIMIGV